MVQFNQLSAREREVLGLVVKGESNKQIALALGISTRTVEFHLKNIYAKCEVASRIELILKLGRATGATIGEKLGSSAVDHSGEKADNGDRIISRTSSMKLFRNTISIISKELGMKNLIKYIAVAAVTANLTGFSWIALFIYYGNLTVHGTKAWAIPLIIVLAVIGCSIALIGIRNRSTLRKVFFSALLGTSLSFFSIVPIMLIVILPLEKLAVRVGLPDPFGSSRMASDVSNLAGTITIIVIWLVTGIAIGTAMLFVSVRNPNKMHNQFFKST